MLIARSSRKDWRCWLIRTSGRTPVVTDARTRGHNRETTRGKTHPLTRTPTTRTPRFQTLQRKCLTIRYKETHQGIPYPPRLILIHCQRNILCILFEKWTHSVEQHQYRKSHNRPFLPPSDTHHLCQKISLRGNWEYAVRPLRIYDWEKSVFNLILGNVLEICFSLLQISVFHTKISQKAFDSYYGAQIRDLLLTNLSNTKSEYSDQCL